jgi:RNA polymerase sigma-70 factor (ECF subfamily)
VPTRQELSLIRRAIEGDERAFDRLVLRYRALVLRIAREALPSRELAEDAAQEALLEAHRSLRWLREPERFEGWLATIARRVAGRAGRRHAARDRTLAEWSWGGTQAIIPEPLGPAQASVAERVREAIEELSERHRRAMTLHYLEGREIAEVGRELGLPGGTVKRILFEARQEIREEIGAMCVDAQQGPARKLVHWIDGSFDSRHPRNVFALMGSLLPQRICLTTNKQAKTLEEIAEQVKAGDEYVAETLALLAEEGIVVREDGKYRADFAALSAEDWQAITEGVRQAGHAAADVLRPHVAKLRAAYERAPMSREWPWETVLWPVVGIFAANTAVRRIFAAETRPEPPVRASGGRYWLVGHEAVEGEEPFWATGFTHCPSQGPDRLGYGVYWTYGLERKYVPFLNMTTQFLGALDRGCTTVAEAAQHIGGEAEDAESIAAQWLAEGLLTNEGGRLRMAFPVFRAADDEALLNAADAAAEDMAEQVLRQAGGRAIDELKARGYAHVGEQLAHWRGHLRGDVCGEAVHCLFDEGLLPKPPQPAPAKWALFGWEYGLRLLEWRP